MYNIRRRFNKVVREFIIYTQDEADTEGIPYSPWRDAEAGGYGLTDDGFVMECLRRIPMKRGTILDFTGGRAITGLKAFEFLPRYSARDWWSLSPSSWIQKEIRTRRAKNVVKLYVQMVLAGKLDWDALGTAYRPDQKIPKATVKRLFRQKEVKKMIAEEMSEALKALGITQKFVLEKILNAITVAEGKGDAGNMLRAAENLADMLEMKPTKGPNMLQMPPIPTIGELPSYDAVMGDLELPSLGSGVEDE